MFPPPDDPLSSHGFRDFHGVRRGGTDFMLSLRTPFIIVKVLECEITIFLPRCPLWCYQIPCPLCLVSAKLVTQLNISLSRVALGTGPRYARQPLGVTNREGAKT